MAEKYCHIKLEFLRSPEAQMLEHARSFRQRLSNRRSIRCFSSEPVPEGVIEECIRTAASAPSGANMQPWFFCVISDPDIKQRIRLAAEEEERKNYEWRMSEEWQEDLAPLGTDAVKDYLEIAPSLIVVFRQNYRLIGGAKRKNYYVNESVGIACGMLIAALHNAGLATLTHTPSPMDFLGEILGRPENETAVLLIPVGFPADGATVPDIQRKPLEGIMKNY